MDRTVDKDTGWKTTFAGTMMIVASILVGLAFTVLIVAVEEGRRVSPSEAQQPAPPVSRPAPSSVPAAAPASMAVSPTASASPAPSPTAVAVAAASAEQSKPTPRAVAGVAATRAPTSAGSPASAQPATEGDAAAGSAIFASLCTGCHPKGGAGVGPDLHGLSGDTVTTTVRAGKGFMPAFGADRISDKQMLDILAYLGTLN